MSLADERAWALLSSLGLPTSKAAPATHDGLAKALLKLDRASIGGISPMEDWVNATRLTAECYRTIWHMLLEDARHASDAIDYWTLMERRPLELYRYLIQTIPLRFYHLLHTAIARVTNHHEGGIQRLWSGFATSWTADTLFPRSRSSTAGSEREGSSRPRRSLLWPLSLVSGEARAKRLGCCEVLQSIERRIGLLSSVASHAKPTASEDIVEQTRLGKVASELYFVLGDPALQPQVYSPRHGSELRAILGHLLDRIEEYRTDLDSALRENVPPSWITRAWPVVVVIPLTAYWLATRLWANRDVLNRWKQSAQETVHGFAIDWVIEPSLRILATVRHGDDTLAIMGKQSLSSDLDSLERMVADFARDQNGFSDAQIELIAQRVREGDLSPVLRAWEADIKTPVRSAITGSLLRTLLIQVQKVKVDLALAMSGVEKMLRSQQLTFAFVGIAPSLMILIGLERLLSWLVSTQTGLDAKPSRRQAWTVMRSVRRPIFSERDVQVLVRRKIDRLVQPGTDFSLNSVAGQTNTGRLFIEASRLRRFANRRDGPLYRDADLRSAFLDDVRALEESPNKRWVVERFYRCWNQPLFCP